MKRRSGDQLALFSADHTQPTNTPSDIDEVEFLRRFQQTIEQNQPDDNVVHEIRKTSGPLVPQTDTAVSTVSKVVIEPDPTPPASRLIDVILPKQQGAAVFYASAQSPKTTSAPQRIRRARPTSHSDNEVSA